MPMMALDFFCEGGTGWFLRLVRLLLVLGKHCLMAWVYRGFAHVYKGMGNTVSGHLTDHLTFK